MAATLFISDLHLQASQPHLTAILLRFLAGPARNADALYILGDLFESWIGDDDDDPLASTVQSALRDVTRFGVRCWFMGGNRDFLVGKGFAQSTGVALLDETAVVDLYGTPTLLLHGDTLCTDDAPYQALRATLHDPAWQANFLAGPLERRRSFAEEARRQSSMHTKSADPTLMDATTIAVEAAFRRYDVVRMIHGHTHLPNLHRYVVDGVPRERWVLSDWRQEGEALAVGPQGIQRIALR